MNKSIPVALFLVVSLLAACAAPKASGFPAQVDEKGLLALLADTTAKPLLLDVRTAEEYEAGFIPGALLLPYDEIASKFAEADKDRPIVVYCRSGRRSALARTTLLGMGYTKVADFGAVTKWTSPLETR